MCSAQPGRAPASPRRGAPADACAPPSGEIHVPPSSGARHCVCRAWGRTEAREDQRVSAFSTTASAFYLHVPQCVWRSPERAAPLTSSCQVVSLLMHVLCRYCAQGDALAARVTRRAPTAPMDDEQRDVWKLDSLSRSNWVVTARTLPPPRSPSAPRPRDRYFEVLVQVQCSLKS